MAAVEAQVSGLPCLLSEEVPDEADVSDRCVFIPIDSSDAWIGALVSCCIHPRNETADSVFSSFEIGNASDHLLSLYEQMNCTSK